MPKIARKDDTTVGKGMVVTVASTVFANGIAVGIHTSDIAKHPGGGKHNASKTTEGSPTVFADGKPVLRVGSGSTCGHKVNQGSPDVFVP